MPTYEVKPCPFCGDAIGHAGMTPAAFAKTATEFSVECRACQSFGPFRATMEQAVEAWNTRAVAQGAGMREALLLGLLLSRTGDGQPRIEFCFNTLEEMQDARQEVVAFLNASLPSTDRE